MRRFIYTPDMDNWMRKHYQLRLDQLTSAFNQHFNVERSSEAINGLRKRLGLKTGRTGCYAKGHVPENKGTKGLTGANSGSFKPSNRPHNYQSIGSEAITKEGYIRVKVADPDQWELKHRTVWALHNGPIPEGYIVKFIDDDKRNCAIENLMLVSHREHAVINRFYPGAPAEYKAITVQLARIKMTINDKIKRQDQC